MSIAMPEVLREKGYKFRFYSNEKGEPPHVHVIKAENEAKFWLRPVRLEYSYGYTTRELSDIEEILRAHHRELMRRWNEHIAEG